MQIKDEELRKSLFIDPRSYLYLEVVKDHPYDKNHVSGLRVWLDVRGDKYSYQNDERKSYVGFYKGKKKGREYEVEYNHIEGFSKETIDWLFKNNKFISFSEVINDTNIGNYLPLRIGFEGEKPLEVKEELILQDFSKLVMNKFFPSDEIIDKILDKVNGLALTQEQSQKIPPNIELSRVLDNEPFEKEGKHGVLLYGPPGTGKTTTMNVFMDIFRLLGCQVHSVNAHELVSKALVGAFAGEVSKQIFEPAIKYILKDRRPCFIYVDEATSLVSKPKENGVSEWYQEGLDTIKAFLNRSRFPGIILCLATNAQKSQLDETIVGDDGRLEAVYFDFLSKDQFTVLWKDKLNKNLKLKDVSMFQDSEIDKLSEVCSNTVSGRFVSNFCATYRDTYLTPKGLSLGEIIGLRHSREGKRNITQEILGKEINFIDFYENFLNRLKSKLNEETRSKVEEIKREHYYTREEKDTKEEEARKKYKAKLDNIEQELKRIKDIPNDMRGPFDKKQLINELSSLISILQKEFYQNNSFSEVSNLEQTLTSIRSKISYLFKEFQKIKGSKDIGFFTLINNFEIISRNLFNILNSGKIESESFQTCKDLSGKIITLGTKIINSFS